MDDVESLTHTLWECKYHVVWIPKYRKKVMFCKLREQMGALLKDLAMQKGCKILEGHLRPYHVHMRITILPKSPFSSVIEFLKGKSAIAVARQFSGKERIFTGEPLWARGYAVSTVGFELDRVRQYIRAQEEVHGSKGRF